MNEFSLEKISEKIHYGKTKEYFREVLSSYQNENYRSAVVMLWSVAICDIVYKLQNLVDLYSDSSAQKILQDMTELQEKNPKSSEWEIKIIEETRNRTNLIDEPEYQNLVYLQKQRHLSAHPILNRQSELHTPNKETVRSLLRNTLEGLLVKPPFYSQKILDEILEDISESRFILNTKEKVKQYVESRYLNRLKPEIELSIFRSLWKIVFKLNNEDCETNRIINFRTLEVISKRNVNQLHKKIQEEKDYYSNISSHGNSLVYLVLYLTRYNFLFDLLNDDAQMKIKHCIETNTIAKIFGWFIKESLENHYHDLLNWLEKDNPKFESTYWKPLLEISDTSEWQDLFCKLVSTYYGVSQKFYQADDRFSEAIKPYLYLFNEKTLIFLLNKMALRYLLC